jgi:hypothetical protein
MHERANRALESTLPHFPLVRLRDFPGLEYALEYSVREPGKCFFERQVPFVLQVRASPTEQKQSETRFAAALNLPSTSAAVTGRKSGTDCVTYFQK